MFAVQADQAAIALGRRIGCVVRNRIAVEEGEDVVVADLLPRIEERQGARRDEGEERQDVVRRPHAGVLGAAPRIFVVVRGEAQPQGRGGKSVVAEVVAQHGNADPLLRHVVQQVVHPPAVVGVEAAPLGQFALLGLGQQEEVGLRAPQLGRGELPEIGRHEHRHVAAEAVDRMFRQPEAHRVDLPLPHLAVRVVELRRVGPVPGDLRHAVFVFVPGGVFGDPAGVACRVVGHPVEQHLHAQPMRFGDEGVQIGEGAQFGVDGAVVADRIVGAERSLAALDADRMDRHEPHDVDAQLAEPLEMRLRGPQRAFGGQLPHVHFIEYGLIDPFGMFHRNRFLENEGTFFSPSVQIARLCRRGGGPRDRPLVFGR